MRIRWLIASAVALPLTATAACTDNSASPHRAAPSVAATSSTTGQTAQDWHSPNAIAATVTSDGTVWTAVATVTSNDQRWFVVHQSGEDRRVLQRIRVPGPISFIAAGAGHVWAFGGGDGGYPDGVLNAISPTGVLSTLRFHNSGPYDIAFVGASAYVTLPAARRVDRLEFPGVAPRLTISGSVLLPSQVTDIVATASGQVWAREDLVRRIVRIMPGNGTRLRAAAAFPWKGGWFSATGSNAVWTTDDPHRVVSLTPATYSSNPSQSAGYRIGTPPRPYAVTEDSSGGLYVATGPGIAYFAGYQHIDGNAKPTALLTMSDMRSVVLSDVDVRSLVALPTGGVMYAGDGFQGVWQPSGAAARK